MIGFTPEQFDALAEASPHLYVDAVSDEHQRDRWHAEAVYADDLDVHGIYIVQTAYADDDTSNESAHQYAALLHPDEAVALAHALLACALSAKGVLS